MKKEEIKLEYQKAFNERFKTPKGCDKYGYWASFAIDDFIAEFIVNKLTIPVVGRSLLEQKVIEIEDEISRLKEFTGLDQL